MNVSSFTAQFDNEETCIKYFKSERDKIEVTCNRCNHKEHFWIKSIWSYECKKCRIRTSLRCGTILHNSNLSFIVWYKTMF